MHRNGGLLPVVVKLQVGGRENLGRGARLDALAACARREINKTQICQFSRFKTRQTRIHSSPDQNHIERAYRARPPVGRSIDRPTDRSFARHVDRATDATAARDTSKSFAPIRARIDTAASSRAVDVERVASHRVKGNGSRYASVGTVLERNRTWI